MPQPWRVRRRRQSGRKEAVTRRKRSQDKRAASKGRCSNISKRRVLQRPASSRDDVVLRRPRNPRLAISDRVVPRRVDALSGISRWSILYSCMGISFYKQHSTLDKIAYCVTTIIGYNACFPHIHRGDLTVSRRPLSRPAGIVFHRQSTMRPRRSWWWST